jgi:hypothetical protein
MMSLGRGMPNERSSPDHAIGSDRATMPSQRRGHIVVLGPQLRRRVGSPRTAEKQQWQ